MTLACLIACFNLPLLSTLSVCISLLFWIHNGCLLLLSPKLSWNALRLFWTELSDMVYSSKIKLERFIFAKEISYFLFHIIRNICFFSSAKKFVNKVNDWLIKTDSFLNDKFIFILNTDWRRNNWMLITHFNKS